MKKNIVIPIIIITILLLLYFFSQNDVSFSSAPSNTKLRASELEKVEVVLGNKEKEIRMNFKKIENAEQKRRFVDYDADLDFTLGGIEKELFLYPSRVKVDNNDNVYVLDVLASKVKKFDIRGNFILEVGNKGKGPGEFERAFDFDIYGEKIAITSPNDNKFTVFDENNSSKFYEIKTTLFPNRLSFVSNDEIVILQMLDPLGSSPVIKTNYSTEKKLYYQNILDTESFDQNYGLLPFLVGSVHRYNSGKLVYISSVLGYVVVFDEKGEIEKAFKLIDTPVYPLKKNKQHSSSAVGFPRREEYLALSSNVFDQNLYILSGQTFDKPSEFFVDIYSIKEAKYKFSLSINSDVGILSVYFTNKKFYLVKENTEISVYNYKLGDG